MDKWYQERWYRRLSAPSNLEKFKVKIRESDILAFADSNLESRLYETVAEARRQIERYIEKDSLFAKSLEPYEINEDAPDIVKKMAIAGDNWNVGPMAAVAGAIADYAGKELRKYSSSVIIENGGDTFIIQNRETVLQLYAGEESPFTGKILFELPPASNGMGVCTSSATIGHSFSEGIADAAVAVAESVVEADAAATALCNLIKSPEDVDKVLEYGASSGKLQGIIVAVGDKIGIWGNIKLLKKE